MSPSRVKDLETLCLPCVHPLTLAVNQFEITSSSATIFESVTRR